MIYSGHEWMDLFTIHLLAANHAHAHTMPPTIAMVMTARDTDEIITQGIPLYFRKPGRGIRPGRNEIESVNRPITCGNVLVKPGDVIVADGDGVVVVPRAVASEVARYAHKIIEGDKAARRKLYQQLGLPDDPSVK